LRILGASKHQNIGQNNITELPRRFFPSVAQRVSFATVFQAYEINGLRVANGNFSLVAGSLQINGL
jgi:hypothetical protein